jgi:eukaryotic-like serine/threonine-protein kinase
MRTISDSEAKAERSPSTRDLSFGRYETIAKIGEGASGQVFLARARGEAGFERLFAIKVLHRDNPEVSSALLREAQLACRIQHRNVVSVVDVGANRDGPFLVMEYVEGCTLSDLNARCKKERPARLVLPILVDALYGLAAIHTSKDDHGASLGLVHRDVSPQNLLVGVDGASRISDFGIAAPHNRVRQTRTDRVRGTPGYMSPEQVVGGELDLRSDLFSAGVVLWNTLTGKRLFDGPTEHASLFHVLKRKIPKPSQVGLCPPVAFDALILRALERDPARRFQSAEEMAVALRDAAIRSSALGGPSEVAAWVTSTFGVELEARRRAIRDATAQRAAPRPDADRASSVSLAIALPRLKSATQPVSDPSERLSLDDLSLESDEIDVVRNLLGPGARAAEPADKRGDRVSWRRWLPVAAAALLLLGAGGWLLTRGGGEAKAPAAASARAQPAGDLRAATAAPAATSAAAAAEPPAESLPKEAAPAPAPAVATNEPAAAGDQPAATGGDDGASDRTTEEPARREPGGAEASKRGDRRTPKRTPPSAASEKPEAPSAEPEKPQRPQTSEVEGNPYIYKK